MMIDVWVLGCFFLTFVQIIRWYQWDNLPQTTWLHKSTNINANMWLRQRLLWMLTFTSGRQINRCPERHVDDITDMRRSCRLRENTSGRRSLGSSPRLLKVPIVTVLCNVEPKAKAAEMIIITLSNRDNSVNVSGEKKYSHMKNSGVSIFWVYAKTL